ncbi:MAG: addiction module protein, partial [Chloroflexota bacterium]
AQMPVNTRAFIAEKILEMLDTEEVILSSEWKQLIQERLADIDTGNVEMIKAEDAFQSIWSDLE